MVVGGQGKAWNWRRQSVARRAPQRRPDISVDFFYLHRVRLARGLFHLFHPTISLPPVRGRTAFRGSARTTIARSIAIRRVDRCSRYPSIRSVYLSASPSFLSVFDSRVSSVRWRDSPCREIEDFRERQPNVESVNPARRRVSTRRPDITYAPLSTESPVRTSRALMKRLVRSPFRRCDLRNVESVLERASGAPRDQ